MFMDDIETEIVDAASENGVNSEDVGFVEQQREDRSPSSMTGIDNIHAAKKEKKDQAKHLRKEETLQS